MNAASLDDNALKSAVGRFEKLVVTKSGQTFSNVDEGMIATLEDCKARLRDSARNALYTRWTPKPRAH